jgi:hypothetical protein
MDGMLTDPVRTDETVGQGGTEMVVLTHRNPTPTAAASVEK